jgi:hypothetical protein
VCAENIAVQAQSPDVSPNLFISSLSRALLLLEFAGEAWHGRRIGSPLILVLVTGPARARCHSI